MRRIRCKHYIADGTRHINCKAVKDCMTVTVVFADRYIKTDYKRTFCTQDKCTECPYFQAAEIGSYNPLDE